MDFIFNRSLRVEPYDKDEIKKIIENGNAEQRAELLIRDAEGWESIDPHFLSTRSRNKLRLIAQRGDEGALIHYYLQVYDKGKIYGTALFFSFKDTTQAIQKAILLKQVYDTINGMSEFMSELEEFVEKCNPNSRGEGFDDFQSRMSSAKDKLESARDEVTLWLGRLKARINGFELKMKERDLYWLYPRANWDLVKRIERDDFIKNDEDFSVYMRSELLKREKEGHTITDEERARAIIPAYSEVEPLNDPTEWAGNLLDGFLDEAKRDYNARIQANKA